MKRGSFLPNLSEMGLTRMLPMKKPAKITEVETKPKDPRSHTRSNYESKEIRHYYIENVTGKKTVERKQERINKRNTERKEKKRRRGGIFKTARIHFQNNYGISDSRNIIFHH